MDPKDTFTKEEQELILIGAQSILEVAQVDLTIEIKSIESANGSIARRMWLDGHSEEFIGGAIAGLNTALDIIKSINIKQEQEK
jgi:hypothetical protein